MEIITQFVFLYKAKILVLFLIIRSICSLQFEFPSFDSTVVDISYQGDATPSQGEINLNVVDVINRVGWASYSHKVAMWDPKTGQTSDFTTRFSFVIDNDLGSTSHGDGFCFFIAPFGSMIAPNSAGKYMGLFNSTTAAFNKLNQLVAIEFDTYINGIVDPPYEHVGIVVSSLSSVANFPWNSSMYSGDVIDVWIMYNSSTTNLSVYWANKTEINSTLSYKVDLKTVLPQWVMVGFSAATGRAVEKHVIKSWEFSSSLNIKEQSGTTSHIKLILGVSLSIGPLVVVILLVITMKARCKSKDVDINSKYMSMNDDLERGTGPRPFSYGDLVMATNKFSKERKLGEGGFGSVYKGYTTSADMLIIAVKKISKRSKQGKKEYLTEIKIISQLRHRNLVRLIGWCHEYRGEFLIVYEFMPNRSLDVHLFGKRVVLDWVTRHNIALGLASAILYLHEECERCVVHRDIKSSNIMLDSTFNAKLGDFGLARLADHEHVLESTKLAGTLGYMAPECLRTGRASKESDIYSFGVVILEIVTGKQCRDAKLAEFQSGLVEWVWDLYENGKVLEAIDERLNGKFNGIEAECLVMVGLWSAHPDPNFRPPIKQAMRVLSSESPLPNLPLKMPMPMPKTEFSIPNITIKESLTSSSSMQNGR